MLTTDGLYELVSLRQQLIAAWSENPFPVDKIVALNASIRSTLIKYGLDYKPKAYKRHVWSEEERRTRGQVSREYWVKRRIARGEQAANG